MGGSSTTINFALSQAGSFVLDLFDVQGRQVRRLINGSSDGRGSTVWNGLDESGAYVAPGVYFLRLQQGDLARSQKLVRIDD